MREKRRDRTQARTLCTTRNNSIRQHETSHKLPTHSASKQRKMTNVAKQTNHSPSQPKNCKKEHMEKTHSNRMQCKLSRRIKAMETEECQRGLTEVIVPHPTMVETRRITTGMEQLEQACLAEAGRRFTQAKDTPFLLGPLRSIFGENLDAPAFQEVLNGTFQIPLNCNPYAARLLVAMKKLAISNIEPRTSKSHTNGWKKV